MFNEGFKAFSHSSKSEPKTGFFSRVLDFQEFLKRPQNMFSWCFLSVSWYFSIIGHLSREPDFLAKNRIFKNFWRCLKACLVIRIDHDTVCAGVVGTAIRNSTSCAGRRAAAPAGTTSAVPDCSTNQDSADRISGQFLFYHDLNATFNVNFTCTMTTFKHIVWNSNMYATVPGSRLLPSVDVRDMASYF